MNLPSLDNSPLQPPLPRSHHHSHQGRLRIPRFHNPFTQLILAIAAASLCALGLNSRAWSLVAGLVTLGLLGLLWPWLSLRGIAACLSFDRSRAQEGDILSARLQLTNSSWISAWSLHLQLPDSSLLPENHLAPKSEALPLGFAIDRAPPKHTLSSECDLIAARRGAFPQNPLYIASAFPFGIAACTRPVSIERPLIIWPRIFPLAPHAFENLGLQGSGLALRNRSGDSGDILGTRLYRRGDPLKHINWPQTAKHDQLMVRELQQSAKPCARIIIDTNPSAHVGSDHHSTFEWTIRIAASLVHHLLLAQTSILLDTSSNRLITTQSDSLSARKRCLDALALLQPDSDNNTHPYALIHTPNSHGAALKTILITTDHGLPDWSHLLTPSLAPTTRGIILETNGFNANASPSENRDCLPSRSPGSNHLWIPNPDSVPHALKHWVA